METGRVSGAIEEIVGVRGNNKGEELRIVQECTEYDQEVQIRGGKARTTKKCNSVQSRSALVYRREKQEVETGRVSTAMV